MQRVYACAETQFVILYDHFGVKEKHEVKSTQIANIMIALNCVSTLTWNTSLHKEVINIPEDDVHDRDSRVVLLSWLTFDLRHHTCSIYHTKNIIISSYKNKSADDFSTRCPREPIIGCRWLFCNRIALFSTKLIWAESGPRRARYWFTNFLGANCAFVV